MRILVTGGLGYIGSHTVVELLAAGYEVTIIDNLINSTDRVLDRIEQIANTRPDFFQGDIRDKVLLRTIFSTHPIAGVIHFAALKAVDESFEKPDEYFSVNVDGTRALREVMEEFGVRRMVFSSSAAIYGHILTNPILETTEPHPTSPYGETKLACEKYFEELARENSEWSVMILRYFNPVGAHESGLIGDAPKQAASIAAITMEVLRGVRPLVKINGDDYDTPDGTCIRDFIHVMDLASAHVFALKHALSHSGAHIYNVGTGRGFSVKEIIAAFSAAANTQIPTEVGERRPGDIVVAVADPTRINAELGWSAQRGLTDITESTVNWITKNPKGF